MFNVYLAGSISGMTYEDATEWRRKADILLKQTGINFNSVDPMRGKENLFGSSELPHESPKHPAKHIWLRDKYDVESCDGMIVNFLNCKRVSIGTCVEIGMGVEQEIPIIVIMEENNIHNHPFITEPAYRVVRTLEEAIDVLCDLIV